MAATPLPQEILRAWQRIEFFQPYTPEKKDKSLFIKLNQLKTRGDILLPWHSEDLRREYEIPDKAHYIVHIGLFEKNIASKLSLKIFGVDEEQDAEECEQRLSQEGTTCFAKVQLNAGGVPEMDKLSVSSLPWALGHLAKQRFQQLESVIFANDCKQLANTLSQFKATLKPAGEQHSGVLRASDIITLLTTHLVEWADFSPDWQYALQIDWFESKNEEQTAQAEEQTEDSDADEALSDGAKALALPILNSFFFEDIEEAIASLKNRPCQTLTTYLSQRTRRNPDLYSQDGLAAIIDKLHPWKMPLGRWPSEPSHPMSLMQQFAINTAVEELEEGGVLSVNGPPGTGKTTLLRDLVAHNLVERATELMGFSTVDDTLDTDGFIVAKLTGFEMIVASSNNAAVENISRELPQLASLAEEFRDLDYLSPTANQVAATSLPKRERKKGKNGEDKEREYHLFRPLEEKKQCWGLISAALGKKGNRTRFAQRLFIDEHFLRKTPAETSRPASENFLSLWRWKACHSKTSFADAKKKFHQCLTELLRQYSLLEELARLVDQKPDEAVDSLPLALGKTERQIAELTTQLRQCEAERDAATQHVQHAVQQQKIIESNAPGWFDLLFNRKKVRAHKASLENAQQHLLARHALLAQKMERVAEQHLQLIKASTQQEALQHQLEALNSARESAEKRLQELLANFPGIALPDSKKSIDNPELQRTAFWQNAQINRQRSALFVAAMELHQAWLYEAMGIDRFRNNLFELKNFLSAPHLDHAPLRWWQLLCMFVPVLSTTFASVGRMLHGVKSETLGWLMIDEAGQASPQQAVGAIWRAKRVLIVGDPLQIEPVFTTSPTLVNRLCEDALQEHAPEWNPAKLSVQQVADRVNRWGCNLEVMNCEVWIGIPLWVHRRCIEPMFSIANKLAYNNRMIHGLNADKIISQSVSDDLENHWLIARGGQGEKQYRDSHGKSLLTLLDRLLAENVALGSIYIITPFKAVKYALTELIEQRELKRWQASSPLLTRKEITEWQSRCIGTVHTFQGKENDIVILVLGCDEQNNGGAKWASSKPNLLNVAITRAKKHIFVIGDKAVWGDLRGFEDVARVLVEKRETGVREVAEWV
ncbi:DEAD/DEAH box helicase [Enterobacter sp.]|uniref:DEAD/DEAH box helicase n=1 Tax=Enterobacter sp. TaxID=42895 RepID=UPI00296E8196|nr:AAA domain-containing protein [Enterobacter sp.]